MDKNSLQSNLNHQWPDQSIEKEFSLVYKSIIDPSQNLRPLNEKKSKLDAEQHSYFTDVLKQLDSDERFYRENEFSPPINISKLAPNGEENKSSFNESNFFQTSHIKSKIEKNLFKDKSKSYFDGKSESNNLSPENSRIMLNHNHEKKLSRHDKSDHYQEIMSKSPQQSKDEAETSFLSQVDAYFEKEEKEKEKTIKSEFFFNMSLRSSLPNISNVQKERRNSLPLVPVSKPKGRSRSLPKLELKSIQLDMINDKAFVSEETYKKVVSMQTKLQRKYLLRLQMLLMKHKIVRTDVQANFVRRVLSKVRRKRLGKFNRFMSNIIPCFN